MQAVFLYPYILNHLWKMAPSLCKSKYEMLWRFFLYKYFIVTSWFISFSSELCIQNWIAFTNTYHFMWFFFSQLNASLFYCVIMFRNVFMLQFKLSQEITNYCDWTCYRWDLFRQTKVVFEILSNRTTIYTFFQFIALLEPLVSKYISKRVEVKVLD